MKGESLKDLKKEIIYRILEISHKHKLSHLGSCITAVDPLIAIFTKMYIEYDRFVLSSGHSGLAYYVLLEVLGEGDAELMLETAGIHPDRSINQRLAFEGKGKRDPIHCSTGSLGQGLPIALGMALSDPDLDVYCLISDGECAEGSIWEALRIKYELGVDNLKVYVNINGYSAYSMIDTDMLEERLKLFDPEITIFKTNTNDYKFLEGLAGHYHVMSDIDYEQACKFLGVIDGTVG